MSNQREKKHAHKGEHEGAEIGSEHHDEHHLVEAPRGTSRTRFLFNLILVVFLLLIFSITGPMMSSLSGGNQSSGETYLAWTMPGGDRVTLDANEFITEKRRFARLGPILGYLQFPGVDTGDEIELARFLIVEKLAERAGIWVADDEVSETILTLFVTQENYINFINNSRDLTPVAYEGVLRRGLIVRRYILLQGETAGEILADDVIEQWKENSQEYNFDFVEVLAEDFADAARTALPDDAALEAYFDALPAFQKGRFNTEARLSGEIAWFDPTLERDYSALLARYPAPEDSVPEEVANQYFNSFSSVRFTRPAPDVEGLSDEEREAAMADFEPFYSFDEVAEQARAEAPIYYAMTDWLADLRERTANGETADLETEAIVYGLDFVSFEPRTRAEFSGGEEAWSGRYLMGTLAGGTPGEVSTRVVVEENAIVVPRLLERLDPTLPPFADVRDKVADKWVEEEQPKLAVAKLESLRDLFGERPETGVFEPTATAEAFAAAVEAAGFEVQQRGWKRQYPAADDEDRPTQAEFYIRSRASLFTLEDGDVAEAEASRDGKAAYLLRSMGSRYPDPADMTPLEAAATQAQLESAAATEFYTGTLRNNDWLISTYNIQLRSLQEEESGS